MTSVANADYDPRPETTRALGQEYATLHASLENYFNAFHVPFALLERLGVAPRSPKGFLVFGLLLSTFILGPALILTALTGAWSTTPLVSWIILAVVIGFGIYVGYITGSLAAGNIAALGGALICEDDIHRMLAWHERWYNHRVTALVAGIVAVMFLGALVVLQRLTPGPPLPIGTLWIGVVMAYVVGETALATFLTLLEIWNLSSKRMVLYGLSPIDSPVIRQAMRGFNQLAAVLILVVTPLILGFIVVLPTNPVLIVPTVVYLLLILYSCMAFGTLVPRALVGRIVRAKKSEEMNALWPQLNNYLARAKQLSDEEYAEMQRLQAIHDTIRDSPENLLPLGWVVRVLGALLLTTLSVILTTILQSFISQWLSRSAF